MSDEDLGSEEQAAIFMGSSTSAKTMADGSLRLTIDLSPADAIGAFTAFGKPGSGVAIARISDQAAVEATRPKSVKGPYGKFAQKLVQSGFFRTPEVWKAIGSDTAYLEWVKVQPSAISGQFSEYHETGDKYCIPAHVRRVEHGAGTAHKPPYSAIPLTNAEHQETHQHGDTNLRSEEWWQKMRISYVSKWAYEELKEYFGVNSYTYLEPKRLVEWATNKAVTQYLPKSIVDAATEEHQEESEA